MNRPPMNMFRPLNTAWSIIVTANLPNPRVIGGWRSGTRTNNTRGAARPPKVSVGPSHLKYGAGCFEQDREVLEEGPVTNIVDFEPHDLLEGTNIVPTGDLPRAGYPGLYVETRIVVSFVQRDLARQ